MKTASPGLIALLASRQFIAISLFKFTLTNGTVLTYTDGESSVVWDSLTWSAGAPAGPYFNKQGKKAITKWRLGLEVDTLEFDVIPGDATVLGVPFLKAIKQGIFDGAEFTLYRLIMPSGSYGDTSNGTVLMFAGRVGEANESRSLATFIINSHLELLNQDLPRNICQTNCINSLYDSGCTLNKTSFSASASALVTSTTSTIKATLAGATGIYNLGFMTFTSGPNAGVSRTVKSHTAGSPATISLISPFPNVPGIGDTFTIYQGCDKKQSTCSSKFSNLANFRGFPYIPENTTAV